MLIKCLVTLAVLFTACSTPDDNTSVPADTTVTLEDGTAGDNKVIISLSNGRWNSSYMSFMTGNNAIGPFQFGSASNGIAASWVVKSNPGQVEITFTGINYSGAVSLYTEALDSLKMLMQGVSAAPTMSGSNMVNIVVTTGGNAFVPVENIVDLPGIAIVNNQLKLGGTVQPPNATNQTVVWSGDNVNSATGSFNATSNGTFQVTATIANGKTETTPFVKTFDIEVYIGDLHDYDGAWKKGEETIIINGNNWEFSGSLFSFRGIIVKLEGANSAVGQVTSVYDNSKAQWVPHFWYDTTATYTVLGDTLTISGSGVEAVDGTYVKQN
jgi:hypothetical protein